jgi:ribosomal subunit interface protein
MTDENITIGSAHVELGSSFREDAQRRIREVAHKYLGGLTIASVHLASEGTSFRCSVNMQMGGNKQASAEASAPDVPLAFQAALSKVSKQLRRTKRLQRDDKPGQPDRIATA